MTAAPKGRTDIIPPPDLKNSKTCARRNKTTTFFLFGYSIMEEFLERILSFMLKHLLAVIWYLYIIIIC